MKASEYKKLFKVILETTRKYNFKWHIYSETIKDPHAERLVYTIGFKHNDRTFECSTQDFMSQVDYFVELLEYTIEQLIEEGEIDAPVPQKGEK